MASERLSQLDKALLGLRSLILSGHFDLNQRLPEVAVAKHLGTSRTPLRQAMDRLVAEGLLERIETGGCRVATFSKEDIADAIEFRGVVEGTAARMAAQRGGNPGLMAEARATLDRIDQALDPSQEIDFDRYVHENAKFHALLTRLAGSPLIEREVARMSRLPLASPSAFLSDQAMIPNFQDSLRFAQRQHRAILEAIAERDGARAEAMTREHARLALTNFNYITTHQPKLANPVPGLALVASE